MSLHVDVARTFAPRGSDPFDLDVEFSVADGETLVVLGPSGSGKSLLVECVGGFRDHAGRVASGGRELTDLPPEERSFGVVFQEYALFPHRTARENVAFGARYHDRTRSPEELLSEMGIADLADRYPETLSGGEKQRVALARSLAVDPEVLLLDEPLSALDVPTRQTLREELAAVLEERTAVYVTHDRTTARALADRVAVMSEGSMVQVGPPQEVFERPASPFVARFTGANCLSVEDLPPELGSGGTHLAIRPEHVRLHPRPDAEVAGTVERVAREDATNRLTVRVGAATIEAFAKDPPAVGDRVGVELPHESVVRLEGA